MSIQVTSQNKPCATLNVYHDSIIKSFLGRRGVTAVVLETGTLRPGDTVELSKKAEELRIEKEKKLSEERLSKYYQSREYLAECIAEQRKFEHNFSSKQCEYCGQLLTLTIEDFLAHQDVCKADNAQI